MHSYVFVTDICIDDKYGIDLYIYICTYVNIYIYIYIYIFIYM